MRPAGRGLGLPPAWWPLPFPLVSEATENRNPGQADTIVSTVLSSVPSATNPIPWTDRFLQRHLGPSPQEAAAMLAACGFASLEQMIETAVPKSIRLETALDLPPARSEHGLLNELRSVAAKNRVFRPFIGLGYSDCITPGVIQRNVFENPGCYTQYTPYQAEISQGRLEALLNFQTMVTDLTGLEIANASLLDEGTAAAEAMAMCHAA